MTASTTRNPWLVAGGAGSGLVALLHVIIIAVGPKAYRYFGAGRIAPLAERGSWVPALITSVLVLVFMLWALYAFSGAGRMRLPLLRPALFAIGTLYTLRGLVVVPDFLFLLAGRHPAPHMAAFSAVSLCLGILYLVGTVRLARSNRLANT